MAEQVICLNCGRSFTTERVALYRFSFPGSRYCDFCREAERVREEERRADVMWGQAHIPLDHRDSSFENFDAVSGSRHALTVARNWVAELRQGRSPRRGLMLHGPPGSGKTHLAVSVVRAVIYSTAPCRCIFLNVPEWLDAIREAWNENDGPEAPSPRGYPLVVIDDLGAENSTSWTRERLYGLINERETSRGLTIITSNLAPSDLHSTLGAPTASRIARLCAPVPTEDAEDFRVKLAYRAAGGGD